MIAECISVDEALEIERVLITLDRLASMGGHRGAIAQRAIGPVLAVVGAVSPAEVEIHWTADNRRSHDDEAE